MKLFYLMQFLGLLDGTLWEHKLLYFKRQIARMGDILFKVHPKHSLCGHISKNTLTRPTDS